MSNRLHLARLPLAFLTAALTIELLDELVDGVTGAAWPLLREDLALSYTEVGLLLGVPALLANVIEPVFGLLADAGRRRAVILGGGVAFAVSLVLYAVAGNFWALLAASVLFYPASGAFVSLTQAALMDAEPSRRENNMARWTLAGSVGNVVGPLLIGLAVTVGLGWRPVFALLAALTVGALALAWRSREVLTGGRADEGLDWRTSLGEAWAALRRGEVRASLTLLECSNLLLDVFRGFLALYFVDAVGASPAVASLAVAVLTGVGLVGDALVVPLLERVPGAWYVRRSAGMAVLVLPAFLLVPSVPVKLVLLGVLGLLTAGWYAVLQARLYGSLPERSGTVMALGSVAGLAGGAVLPLLGLVAERFGIEAAMWLLLAGPLALVVGVRGRE